MEKRKKVMRQRKMKEGGHQNEIQRSPGSLRNFWPKRNQQTQRFNRFSQRFNKQTYCKMGAFGCSIPHPLPYVFKTPLCLIDFLQTETSSESPPITQPFRDKISILPSKAAATTPQITFCHPFLSQTPTDFQKSYGEYDFLNLFPHSTQLTIYFKLNVLL